MTFKQWCSLCNEPLAEEKAWIAMWQRKRLWFKEGLASWMEGLEWFRVSWQWLASGPSGLSGLGMVRNDASKSQIDLYGLACRVVLRHTVYVPVLFQKVLREGFLRDHRYSQAWKLTQTHVHIYIVKCASALELSRLAKDSHCFRHLCTPKALLMNSNSSKQQILPAWTLL